VGLTVCQYIQQAGSGGGSSAPQHPTKKKGKNKKREKLALKDERILRKSTFSIVQMMRSRMDVD